MRRQLNLDDYECSSLDLKITTIEGGGKLSIGINTQQLEMKSIRIDTIIHNSQKSNYSQQINPSLISHQLSKSNINNHQENYQNNQEQLSEEILKKLQRFLRKMSPIMQNQLLENLPQYNAYGNYNQEYLFRRDSKLTHTLQNLQYKTQQILEISDLAWNSTGIVIAASYAKGIHDGTCSHKSYISLWFIYKRNFKATKPQTIKTTNCINCISFHPKKPSILACGSYTGQILLYDFSKKQQQLLAKSTIDDYFHRDLITKITWWVYRPPGKIQTQYNLLSLATDGKILLWEITNQNLTEQPKSKNLLKYPIKGYLMLRKKQGKVIPVSGLSMNQSKINKNVFVIGSQGGSILRANLNPLSHSLNAQSKVILDIQQNIKFKQKVYPFLLNVPAKNLPQIKSHVEQYCTRHKIKQVNDLSIIFNSRPQMRIIYPNPISFAYQPLTYPISSLSDNRYGMFIANGCQGYSRIFLQGSRKSIEGIQEGWEWGWIDGGSRLGGFIGQQWVVVDFLTQQTVWSVAVGQAKMWRQNGYQIAIACQGTKVKIIELGDKITNEDDHRRRQVNKKIEQLRIE